VVRSPHKNTSMPPWKLDLEYALGAKALAAGRRGHR
jgi:hypothetical protein